MGKNVNMIIGVFITFILLPKLYIYLVIQPLYTNAVHFLSLYGSDHSFQNEPLFLLQLNSPYKIATLLFLNFFLLSTTNF